MNRLRKRRSSTSWETSPARRQCTSIKDITPPPSSHRKSRSTHESSSVASDNESDGAILRYRSSDESDYHGSDEFVPSQDDSSSDQDDSDGTSDDFDLSSGDSTSGSDASSIIYVRDRPATYKANKKGSHPKETRSPGHAPSRVVVTPGVHRILEPFYPKDSFTVVGQTNVDTLEQPTIAKTFNVPITASLAEVHVEDIVKHAKTQVPNGIVVNVPFYSRVYVDGVAYQPGDFVTLQPGQDEHQPRSDLHRVTKQENPWANLWYGKIVYIFAHDDSLSPRPTVYTHIRWLEHASKVPVLMEVAHPNCLCVCNEFEESCSDTDAAAIISHASIRVMENTEPDPEPGTMAAHQFFVRHGWDPDKVSLSDAQPLLEIGPYDSEHHGCLSCERNAGTAEPEYHLNDYVYFTSKQPSTVTWSAVYRLGQIVELGNDEVKVRLLGRYDTTLEALKMCIGQSRFDAEVHKDETRLYLTDRYKHIERERLAGTFFVQYDGPVSDDDEEWFASDNHFWVNTRATRFPVTEIGDLEPITATQLVTCHKCLDAEALRLAQWRQYVSTLQNRPLRGLDLFAGCGGLATAFNQTGFTTKWAVERDESAVMTVRAMHPDTTTLEGDVNDVLYELASGKVREGMPKPGDDVGIIFGGPPCQGFSKLNHFRHVKDERNLLFANMLSWAELYRPSYFVLENVGGMVEMDMDVTQQNGDVLSIGFAILKLVVRVLTALRYQVRVHFLQAGAYGAPQSRHRLIVVASQCGLPLASVPPPSHCFGNGRTKSPKGMPGEVRLLMRPDKGCRYMGLSLGDAIGDLPQFDWRNPHEVIHPSSKDEKEERRRAKRIPTVDCSRGPFGFTKEKEYASLPLTSYQRRCRGDKLKVRQQYTRGYRDLIVERVCNISFNPGACHKDLPRKLTTERLAVSNSHRPYGRLSFDSPAPIASTTVSPSGETGQVLHPSQHRVLTVREYARIQGFPDWYKFSSVNKNVVEYYKQIGNAVPIPLGVAVAKAIQASAFEHWLKKPQGPPADAIPSPRPSRSGSFTIPVHDEIDAAEDDDEFEIDEYLRALSPLAGAEPRLQPTLGSHNPMRRRAQPAPRLTFTGVLLPRLDPAAKALYEPMQTPHGSSSVEQSEQIDMPQPKRRDRLVEIALPTLDAATKAQYHSVSASTKPKVAGSSTASRGRTMEVSIPILDAGLKAQYHPIPAVTATPRAVRATLGDASSPMHARTLEVAVPTIDAAAKAMYHPVEPPSPRRSSRHKNS